MLCPGRLWHKSGFSGELRSKAASESPFLRGKRIRDNHKGVPDFFYTENEGLLTPPSPSLKRDRSNITVHFSE